MRGEPLDTSRQTSSAVYGGEAGAGSAAAAAKVGALNGSTNGHVEPNNGVATPNGTSQASSTSALPSFFGHDREEVTRILIQGLVDLGYQGAANSLSQESGYEVETSHAAAFRLAVLEGNWQEAEALLSGHDSDPPNPRRQSQPGLLLADGASKEEMLFLLRQQKYLELVERRDIGQALMVLREELQPLRRNERQLHALSSLIMVQSSDDLRLQARWDGAAGRSRRDLLSLLSRSISPSAMIPEHRLAELLTQVKERQVADCEYHNTTAWPSLYTDHRCSRDDFPFDVQMELDQHRDEVWAIKFSNDGSMLATASKDKTVKVYDMDRFSVRHNLTEHQQSTVFVAWSPDDSKLVTCSKDHTAKLWDVASGSCLRTVTWHSQPVTAAAWAPDGRSYVTGSFDQARPLAIWDAVTNDPVALHSFERTGCRVSDVAVATLEPARALAAAHEYDALPPVRLVVGCTDRSIHVYDYHRREKISHVQLDHVITNLSLSGDGRELLVNVQANELWTLDVASGEVRHKYKGQKHSEFVIRGSYGGASEGLVVSGSEDSKICIWHRHSARMIEEIDAHAAGCVNAVAWNLSRPWMWASAGDDSVVRIWTRSEPPPPPRRSSAGPASLEWERV